MKRQRGVNLVEAAFVLPVLFLLVLAILGFGVVYANYQAITHAARDGARFAAAPLPGTTAPLPPSPPQPAASVAQKVCSYLVSGLAISTCGSYDGSTDPPTVPTCVVSGGTVPAADDIYVTQCQVTQPNHVIVWYTEVDIRKTVQMPLLPSIALHTTAAMRNETN